MVFKNIRNSKRYDGMNRLSKEYTTTNNKEKVKAQYTYGKTGGVTLVTNDTSSIANKYDNKGLVMEQKLFEDGKAMLWYMATMQMVNVYIVKYIITIQVIMVIMIFNR